MNQTKNFVVNSQLLVASGKSTRLAAIAKKENRVTSQSNLNNKPQQSFVKGLNQQSKEALQQANNVIEARLADILKSYPAGKKNTLFKIKYGVALETINVMTVKAVFLLLNIESVDIRKFSLIENLTSKGEVVERL